MSAIRKTYSHLAAAQRMPTEYEVVTSKLHYYVDRGFEVAVPLADWYRQHQTGSALQCSDWDRFVDPRRTTYTAYVALQRNKEAHVDAVHHSIDERNYDVTLSSAWVDLLERYWSPMRYLGHGLQMIAAYVGQMAPSGRVTITCALQAADELRRIQRIAYRTAQLRHVHPRFGETSRDIWQSADAWQPTRRLVEQMLVTYDWAEAFTALNLCAKPILDTLFLGELPAIARGQGDPSFGDIAFSLDQDCEWHRSWSKALVDLVLSDRAENADVLSRWVDVWLPRAEQAAFGIAFGLESPGAAIVASTRTRAWLRSLGIRAADAVAAAADADADTRRDVTSELNGSDSRRDVASVVGGGPQ
jgi:toluene monooxygenase system protein E